MLTEITDAQALACRKRAAAVLKQCGVKDPRELATYAMTWSDLNARKADIMRASNGLLDRFENADDSQKRDIEAAADALMAMHQDITGEQDMRTRLGNRDPRQHDGDPRRPLPTGVCRESPMGDAGEVEAHALRPEQRFADWTSERRGDEYRDLRLGQYLRAMVTGACPTPSAGPWPRALIRPAVTPCQICCHRA